MNCVLTNAAMSDTYWALALSAMVALFAVFTGFNDAATLVGVGLRAPGVRPAAAMAVLVAAVAAAPLMVGTAVAATLDQRLVSFDPAEGPAPLLIAVAAAAGVTVTLASRGLPTSLTLAVVGGIAGAGVGGRARVDWTVVAAVLAATVVAPIAGALAALATGRLLAALPTPEGAARRLRWLHPTAFIASCLAYGANDGQKMLAVYAAAHGGGPDRYAASPGVVALLAGCFLAGGLLGLRRMAPAVGAALTVTRSDAVVVTEVSGASVVLGTAAIGAPVSMTQSLSGALVGTGLSRGARRVRWRGVLRLGRAWLLTLPAAFLTAAAGCTAVEAARTALAAG